MNTSRNNRRRAAAGMTLVEVMVATVIGALVVAGSLMLFVTFLRLYNTTTLMRNTGNAASRALDRMVYGVGSGAGLREAGGTNVFLTTTANGGWRLDYNSTFFFQYVADSKIITNDTGTLICTNVTSSSVTLYTNNAHNAACRISLSVAQNAGGDTWTNTFTTAVQFRNSPP